MLARTRLRRAPSSMFARPRLRLHPDTCSDSSSPSPMLARTRFRFHRCLLGPMLRLSRPIFAFANYCSDLAPLATCTSTLSLIRFHGCFFLSCFWLAGFLWVFVLGRHATMPQMLLFVFDLVCSLFCFWSSPKSSCFSLAALLR